jgi:aspartate 1-decarboxylase
LCKVIDFNGFRALFKPIKKAKFGRRKKGANSMPAALRIKEHKMKINVMKSKLHCVTVTQAELDYIGSITIDEDLMDAANLIENEMVHVLNKNNGERLITYVIRGQRGSGIICMNGPAALRVRPGDVVIVISYAEMEFEEAKNFRPWVVFPDTQTNKLKAGGH